MLGKNMEDGNDMLVYTVADRLKINCDGKMCVCKEIHRWSELEEG